MSDNIKTALMAGLNAAGAEPLLLTMTTRRLANQEVPELIAKAMKDADAIIPVTSISMVHTNAMKGALEAKKRLLGMILMTEDLILRTWPKTVEELSDLKNRTQKLAQMIDATKKARITSPQGTDLTLEVGKHKSIWNYGVVEELGKLEFLPGGQTATCPNEGTANGQYVLDVSTGFPNYRLVRNPITVIVKNGKAVEIKGGQDAEAFRNYFESFNDSGVFHIAELGTGTNPKCIFTGNALEDERKAGSVRVALGTDVMLGGSHKTKTHVDGMMGQITLDLDGQVPIKDGKFLL